MITMATVPQIANAAHERTRARMVQEGDRVQHRPGSGEDPEPGTMVGTVTKVIKGTTPTGDIARVDWPDNGFGPTNGRHPRFMLGPALEEKTAVNYYLTSGVVGQILNATLHQATLTPQQIKAACWSHGFLDLMGKVFGAPSYYNDPVHGGCRLVAEALHILIPGSSIKAIVPDSPGHREFVEHYVVQAGTQYLDANGAHSAHELLTDWAYHGFELDSTGEPSNAFVDVTPALLARNSGIASPPGAAEKAAEYIREYRG